MHILLIHQAYTPLDQAGGTRHAEIAASLAASGHRVTVISSPVSYLSGTAGDTRQKWIKAQSVIPSITILQTYTFPALHRSFFHRLVSFFSFMLSSFSAGLGVKNVDLVWGTSPPIFQGITAWLLSRLKGAPLLFEVRDLWPAFAVELGVLRNPTIIGASTWLEKFLYRHADRLVVNSPGFIDHVSSRGARRVDVVPNGADPDMFDPASRGAAFRMKHHLQDAFVVLYAGAHGLANDLGTVLEAARLLCAHPRVRFVFLGDGKEKTALQEQARTMGLENVLFLAPVPKTEMKEAVAAADACLAILQPLPLFKTTYPNKVFDYMAAGRPVITAIDGVIRQVVEESGAGLAVPPGDAQALTDAVLRLEKDPALAQAMGLAGRQAVELRYSRRRQAENMAAIMEDMVRMHGRANPPG